MLLGIFAAMLGRRGPLLAGLRLRLGRFGRAGRGMFGFRNWGYRFRNGNGDNILTLWTSPLLAGVISSDPESLAAIFAPKMDHTAYLCSLPISLESATNACSYT
jgi:hypothetical protein